MVIINFGKNLVMQNFFLSSIYTCENKHAFFKKDKNTTLYLLVMGTK